MSVDGKKLDRQNSYLLALDGDVDFEPEDFELVLNRMVRNKDVAACCNQIHPRGSGPLVWFQRFEYAVGHWFQKAAEHVLGCVLCSPGCSFPDPLGSRSRRLARRSVPSASPRLGD